MKIFPTFVAFLENMNFTGKLLPALKLDLLINGSTQLNNYISTISRFLIFFKPQMTYYRVNPGKFLKLNKVWLTHTLEPLLTNNKHKSQIMLKLGQVLTKARLSGLTSLAYFDFRYNVQRSFQNSPYDPEILLNWHLQTLGYFFDFPNFLFCSLNRPVTKNLLLNTK